MDTASARQLHDSLLAEKPEGASHNVDICPFCVESAQSSSPSRIPPSSAGRDVSETTSQSPTHTEGGTPEPMSDTANTISKETHDALLAKAVSDATSTTEAALATKTTELAAANTKVSELTTEVEQLKGDNARLNSELDTAQVSLKTATDEVASLKNDIAAKDAAAAKAEVASKRADQVKNLALFDDEYVAEKASIWADLADADWALRLEEWSKLKPAAASTEKTTDAASAMSGTSEALTKEPVDAASKSTTPARRAALGLI